ncbi:DUF2063 domain-containing protein [Paracoccus sp. (in: a-proteobacteria)]|uniref:HvfC/BufC N-terminal domain-containing protein n=1 Tax=Paracoccus sp. TaxID=267 RepID=UPI0035B36FA1
MPAHADLIAGFRAGLASGVLPWGVTARDPAEAGRRFAVYRNNVAHSLGRALAARYPVIERLLGAEYFAALAREFVTAHPPASPMLFRWGEAFSGFLRDFPPLRDLPYLPEVARLEWLRGEAYHAPDAAAATPEQLAEAAQQPDRRGARLHPSARLLQARYAAVTIWQANQPGTTPGELDAGVPESALILRDPDDRVHVLALQPGDPAMLQALMHGATILMAAVAGQRAGPDHEAGRLMLSLAHAGALTGFPERPAP